MEQKNSGISVFQRYLTVWVALCMVVGVLIGRFLPQIPDFLNRFEYARISIPMAILIWLMIYPMMMKVDFSEYQKCRQESERAVCHLGGELADKAFFYVRNCEFVLFGCIQSIYYSRTCSRISRRGCPARCRTMYGYGFRVEYADKRRSCLYCRTGGNQ